MKKMKAIALIMALIMILAAAACTSPNAKKPGSKADDPTVSGKPAGDNIGEPVGDPVSDGSSIGRRGEPEWRFIRTAYSETAASLAPKVITTVEEFRSDVLAEFRKSGYRSDAESVYNEEFFRNGYLVMFYVTYGSGSVQPEVSSVEKTDGQIVITVNGRMDGDVGTTDMATHIGLVALDSRAWPADSEFKIVGAGSGANTAEG